MKNFWLDRAEKKEISTQQFVELVLNQFKSNSIRNKKKVRPEVMQDGYFDFLKFRIDHTFDMIDIDEYNMNTEGFQEEVERIEAEGWVLDL